MSDTSEDHEPCCRCCNGFGADLSCDGPCWDCRGTGHDHYLEEKVCRCDCAYVGARLVGTPNLCEQCRGLIDEVAQQRMNDVYAQHLRELEEWAKENPI